MSELSPQSYFSLPSYVQFLLNSNILRADQWRVLKDELTLSPHKDISDLLIAYDFIKEEDLLKIRSKLTKHPILNLGNFYLEPEFLELANSTTLKSIGCVAFMRDEHSIHVGMLHPENVFHHDLVKKELCKLFHSSNQTIQLTPYYLTRADFYQLTQVKKSIFSLQEAKEHSPIKLENIIELAVNSGASDIHFHPNPYYVRILFRLDGVIHEMVSFHISEYPAYINRLKLLAELDLGECRRPQSGSFLQEFSHKKIDIRVSFHPTVHGESIVLRLLDTHKTPLKLSELGLFD
ncbi:MAG TPA: ATPase, T2SS/T4P/T4SS family, partial [Alphaproteobacteria bacterium]|nr:ATPase, T2SS/T4P/T4SS family [Alphaproteobacteria bacterium]